MKKYIIPKISIEVLEDDSNILTTSNGWAVDGNTPEEVIKEDEDWKDSGDDDDDEGYGDFLDID